MGTFLLYVFYYVLAVVVLYALVGGEKPKVRITGNGDAVVNPEDIETFEEEMEKSREVEKAVRLMESLEGK